MSEFAEVFCPLCGDKVALFNTDIGFEDTEFFVSHLQKKHQFTKKEAVGFVSILKSMFYGGGGGE